MVIKSATGLKQVLFYGCEIRIESALAQVFVLGYDGKDVSVYASEDPAKAQALANHLFRAYAEGSEKVDVFTWIKKNCPEDIPQAKPALRNPKEAPAAMNKETFI